MPAHLWVTHTDPEDGVLGITQVTRVAVGEFPTCEGEGTGTPCDSLAEGAIVGWFDDGYSSQVAFCGAHIIGDAQVRLTLEKPSGW